MKPFLVNYGAIKGDGFLSRLASERFHLIDEGQPSEINLIKSLNTPLPILYYKDIIALNPSMDDYESLNKDESAFLHTSEPSCLTIYRQGNTHLTWLEDRRLLNIKGYRIYWASESNGPYYALDSLIGGTESNKQLPYEAQWLKLCTVLMDNTVINYGLPIRISADAMNPLIIPVKISEMRGMETVQVRFELYSPGSTPDSVIAYIDENHNNQFDAKEKFYLQGYFNNWSFQKDFKLISGAYGGYEFFIMAYKNGQEFRLPNDGYFSTNVNNRIKNDTYDFFVMDVCSPAWQESYIKNIRKVFDEKGYNTLFVDDCIIEYGSWVGDANPPFNYDKNTWKNNLIGFLQKIKASIQPKPVYINGLYTSSASELLNVVDGGMTEGFACTHWSGELSGEYWKELCNVGLQCQNEYHKTWLALGGIHNSDPESRLYVLGSYMLVAGDKSMLGNANDYQSFAHYPEFDFPFGKPLQNADKNIDELKHICPENSVAYYTREFDNAIVVVNPDPNNYIIFKKPTSWNNLYIDEKLTIDGGRVFSASGSDTVYPKQARIYIKNDKTIASPIIESVSCTGTYDEITQQTKVNIILSVSDPTSTSIHAQPDKPIYIVAFPGNLGGPQLVEFSKTMNYNEMSLLGYTASFIIPPGGLQGKNLIPLVAYSSSGMISVRQVEFEFHNPDVNNMVDNFSFEIDNNSDGVPDLWQPWGKCFTYDTTGLNSKNGSRSVYFKSDSLTESRSLLTTIHVNDSIPRDLILSGWSKANSVSGKKDSDYSLYIDIRYQDDTPLYGQTAQFNTGTHDWEYSEKMIHVDKPIKDIYLYVIFRRHIGEVWFDNLSLKEIKPMSAPEENHPAEIKIFPNPVRNGESLNIQSRGICGFPELHIYDMLGREVKKAKLDLSNGNLQLSQINIENLQSGIYFVTFSGINRQISLMFSKI